MSLLNDSYISFLNLPHRLDRLIHMKNELERVGIKAERTIGKLPHEYDLTDPKFKVQLNRTPGSIGCWYGMVEMMQKALELKKHCFIMEDDVWLANDFKERVNYVERYLETHDWDIFWWGALFHCAPPHWHNGTNVWLKNSNLGRDAELTDDPRIIRTLGCFSTHCWTIRDKSVKKVMDLLESVVHKSIGIDHACIMLQPQLLTYTLVPGSARQIDNLSDIGKGMTMYSNFATLNGTKENSAYWFQENINDFNPETFDWHEIKNKI